METAKIFENGRSQAVRLPEKFRFSGDEVFIHRLGNAVVLVPKEEAWNTFLDGLNGFTDDFLPMDVIRNTRQRGSPYEEIHTGHHEDSTSGFRISAITYILKIYPIKSTAFPHALLFTADGPYYPFFKSSFL